MNLAKDSRLKSFLRKLIVLTFFLSLPLVQVTNSYFTDTAVASENSLLAGDWTAPESEIDPLDEYQNETEFTLTYTALDSVSEVDRVLLFYRYQGGDWALSVADEDVTGSFDFTASDGDGEYEFFSIAIDTYGNIEDDADEDGILEADELPLFGDTSTILDTTSPVTMLSVEPYLAVANEQLYNGGFESGNLDGWTVDSSGSDHQATTEDKKTGNYSALIGFKTANPSAEPAYDSIKQSVSLPSWITSTLSFWYHLLTSDAVSGGFFDATVRYDTEEIKIAHDGWDDPEVFEEDLDWKNVTHQLTGLKGKEIEIQFKVTQPYKDYQTWAYLDDVKVTASQNKATTSTEFKLSNHDGAGSDNATIEYQIDGGDVEEYTGPITLSVGNHTLSYFSTDEAGNVEPEKEINVNVQTDPVNFGVVLNEIMPNPAGSNDNAPAPGGEWVKLYNNSTLDKDVTGWKLKDASGGSLTISGIVPAGGTLIVYRNEDPDFTINDQIETIELYDGTTLVDSYSYDFETGLAEGKSLKRDPDGTGGWKDPEVEKISEDKMATEGVEEIEEIIPEEEIVIKEEKEETTDDVKSEEKLQEEALLEEEGEK